MNAHATTLPAAALRPAGARAADLASMTALGLAIVGSLATEILVRLVV
ncbi:hypothetical protein [Methylobacterium sp. WSM2598]|nr:hypothetical protein [Methylobacterium sp. WSM2598]